MARRASWRRMVVGILLCGVLFGASPPVAHAEESTFSNVGAGIGAAFANLLYIPGKLVYAALGAVTGTLAYGLTLGNMDVASGIWEPTIGGTYVLTPDMMRGEEPIRFNGVRSGDE